MSQYTTLKNQTNILSSSKKTKLFKKNETIYKENDKSNEIFIILDGIVESTTAKNFKSSQLNLQKVVLSKIQTNLVNF